MASPPELMSDLGRERVYLGDAAHGTHRSRTDTPLCPGRLRERVQRTDPAAPEPRVWACFEKMESKIEVSLGFAGWS